jgi:hypothetical protein
MYAECRYAECRYAECRYAECHYAECRYAQCRYAKCRGTELQHFVNVFVYSLALCYSLFSYHVCNYVQSNISKIIFYGR